MHHIRPSTIRRLTRLAKSLYPTLRRIPNPLPRPDSPAYTLKGNNREEAQRRATEFERADSRRLDKGTIRWFADQYVYEGRR